MFLIAVPGNSQDQDLNNAGFSGEGVDCGLYLSGYREFFKIKIYDMARVPWSKAFDSCRESSLRMYVDGVSMYRNFIEEAPDGPAREGLIDTLMLIYDRRMEYFGDEGNVLGRKGRDLLKYRSGDLDQVQNAYEMLGRSLEIEGSKSRESVLPLYFSAALVLERENRMEASRVFEDYMMLSGMLDQMEKRSSRWERTRKSIDDMVLSEGFLSCETLDSYFGNQLGQYRDDKDYLKRVIALYEVPGCRRSDVFLAASGNLYGIDPGPELAHNLGILHILRDEYEKAAAYLQEAVKGENTDRETLAQWNYELALVNMNMEKHCEAIGYAREAIILKEDFSDALILLGDAFIASRDNLGDDFQKQTAFWAAADQYRKAVQADPSAEEKARKRLNESIGQYPGSEDVFFQDLKDGEPYLVGGCINVTTTVQPGV